MTYNSTLVEEEAPAAVLDAPVGRRSRRALLVLVPLILVVVAGAVAVMKPKGVPARAQGPAPVTRTLSDPVGDPFDGDDPRPEPRGDIVASTAEYQADRIVFTLKLTENSDPRTDPNWTSDLTFATWELDTTGDAKVDYAVQYAWDQGELYAIVTQPNQSGSAPPLCQASAVGFTPDSQYAAVIDPACIGKPASFAYRATTSYDTNVSDENAAFVTDAVPDKGMGGRIGAPPSPPKK